MKTNKTVFSTLGASNHSDKERQSDDFYATAPRAVEMLLQLQTFNNNIWEPACGMGHMSKVLKKHGYNVKSTDLIDRGYGQSGVDFLFMNNKEWNGDIITNPPYSFALEFIEKSLDIIHVGNKVAMFLKVQFLEGKARKIFFMEQPPKTVYISSSRILCAKNGIFETVPGKKDGSAVAYAWYIWEKGFNGTTSLKWFN